MDATTEEGQTLSLDIDELTVGQCEFLTDYTGRSLEELIEVIETEAFKTRDVTAIVALAKNPADPASEVEAIRAMKVSELDLSR